MTTTAAPVDGRKSAGRAITVAWLVLCAITIGSWWLAPGHTSAAALPSAAVTTTVVVLGLSRAAW